MSRRGLALIGIAIAASIGLLGIQLASGGADFVPERPADPCQDRASTREDQSLEDLAETVVLAGIDESACDLGISRERLLLALPYDQDRDALAQELGTDEDGLAESIEDGLDGGVDRLDDAGQLPSTATLVPWVADEIGVSRDVVDLIPDALLDALPSTADVLHTAVGAIDVSAVFDQLDQGESFDSILREMLVDAASDEIRGTIDDAIPDPLQDLFN